MSSDSNSTDYYDSIADQYESMYSGPYWSLCKAIIWNYIQSLLPSSPIDSRVLDAGGGTGLWALKMAGLGHSVVLTDTSKKMLSVAQEKIRRGNLQSLVKTILADIVDMPQLDDNTFNLCLAEGDPVSYCSDPQKAISELARVCRPGGYVAVSVDNKLQCATRSLEIGHLDWATEALDNSRGYMPGTEKNQWYSCRVFTIEEVEQIFIDCGLCPVKRIGRPVFAKDNEYLNDPQIYSRFLQLELEFGSLPSAAGMGAHIVVIGKKK